MTNNQLMVLLQFAVFGEAYKVEEITPATFSDDVIFLSTHGFIEDPVDVREQNITFDEHVEKVVKGDLTHKGKAFIKAIPRIKIEMRPVAILEEV